MAYEPTVWVNGETPINETNLNKMERGIKDASAGRHGGSWSGESDATNISLELGTITKSPLTRAVSSFGDGFTITDDGGVQVNSAGLYMVSGSAYISSAINASATTASGGRTVFIYKNDTELSACHENLNVKEIAGTNGFSVAPKIVALEDGDILYLKARTHNTTGTLMPGNASTYLTIVKIADV